jgi:hypothetical protein
MRSVLMAMMCALATCVPPRDAEEPEPEPEPVVAPSGGLGFVVTCLEPADCMRTAANKCPGAYDLKPLGEGKTVAQSEARGVAMSTDHPKGSVTFGRSRRESRSETEKKYLVECKSGAAGGVGSPCQTPEDCVRLRLGLRNAGLPANAVCVRDLNSRQVCAFACRGSEEAQTARLEALCENLRRQCLPTGADESEPPYCVTGD